LWPKQKDRIQIVITHIEQHASLMRNEVRREDIRAEHEARLRALEHFEKMEKTAIHQEYNAIHTHISPTSYDDTLNRIESRLCDGTGKWLVKDSAFRKWLDPADGSTRRIWLQGIPGAGKTFLAAIAIRCAMAHGKTIFAYLGYSSSSSISALSIFHSLIFQVTHDDHEVQALLCRLGRENLRNDLEVATELLKDLLNYTGVAYLILDGIDEITEVERSKLLQQLVRVAEGCKDARILISSRPEADITACIDPEFRSICVNDRNSGSIQAFITRRTKQWLAMRDFFPEDQGEIEALLAPLASKAKGWLCLPLAAAMLESDSFGRHVSLR
jgi:predicted NACHT family NTPase